MPQKQVFVCECVYKSSNGYNSQYKAFGACKQDQKQRGALLVVVVQQPPQYHWEWIIGTDFLAKAKYIFY